MRLAAQLAVAALFGCTPAPADNPSLERACTALVLDYAYLRDSRDVDRYANLFTEDAELTILDQTFTGRATIRQRLVDGQGGPRLRHLMSTIRIFPVNERRARGVSYVTVYQGPAGHDPDGIVPVEGFAIIGEYHDDFVLTPAGWRIARRTLVPVFRYQRAP